MSIDNCLAYATQIAERLKAAHAKGITHRDIKPSNIMVTESGQAKIMDFGLAKFAGQTRLTKTGTTVGTPAYMSPEQINLIDVDHRTDIWSLGVVLYEMITSQLPFKGEYEQALLYSIVNEKPEPLARYKIGVSIGLQNIVDKALDKDRETRYQHIDDLLTDLKRERKSGSQIIAPVGKKKHKLAEVLVAAVAIVAVLVAFFVINTLQKQTARMEEPVVAQAKPLTTSAAIPEVDPDMSPDGSKVAYSANENENWDVWVHEIASGQKLNITKDYDGSDNAAKWSPDGNWIAFTSSRDGGGIYLVSEFGGSIRQIVSDMGVGLNWSLDGKKLVYAVYDTSLNDTLNTLKIVTVGDRVKRTIPLSHDCLDPAWSPDGNRIVYLSWNDINMQIRTVDVDGVDPVKLAKRGN